MIERQVVADTTGAVASTTSANIARSRFSTATVAAADGVAKVKRTNVAIPLPQRRDRDKQPAKGLWPAAGEKRYRGIIPFRLALQSQAAARALS